MTLVRQNAQTMWRTFVVLATLGCACAQRRCKLGHVRRSDGSFLLGGCDELLLHGEKIGDDGAVALAKELGTDRNLKLLDLQVPHAY